MPVTCAVAVGASIGSASAPRLNLRLVICDIRILQPAEAQTELLIVEAV
jgi:hypothetical protein